MHNIIYINMYNSVKNINIVKNESIQILVGNILVFMLYNT